MAKFKNIFQSTVNCLWYRIWDFIVTRPQCDLVILITYHNEENKVDPVPKGVRVLNEVHHVGPALQAYDLRKQPKKKKDESGGFFYPLTKGRERSCHNSGSFVFFPDPLSQKAMFRKFAPKMSFYFVSFRRNK